MRRSRQSRIPDPDQRFREVPQRRVPQLEFGATIPTFAAIQEAAFTTVTDAFDTVLLWDQWSNCDTRVFDEVTTGSPAKVTAVNLLLPGRYTLTCGVIWATNWNADARIILAGSYDFNNEQDFIGRLGGWTGAITACFSLIYPALFEPGPGAAPPFAQVQWQVTQHSGVSKDTDLGTFMQITYDGDICFYPEET